ncbi:MAG: hypothetical protein ACK2UB_08375 [Anaerolineales bacterium]
MEIPAVRTLCKRLQSAGTEPFAFIPILLVFLPITISCISIGQLSLFLGTPPMDVVLVIDASESMAWGSVPDPALNYDEDPANPAVCNRDDSCHPFQEVKAAAAGFAAAVLDRPAMIEPDRLAIVAFANGWQEEPRGTWVLLNGNWTNDLKEALNPINGISSLKVYDPGTICPFNGFGCGEEIGTACPPTVDDIPTGPCTMVGINHFATPATYPFQGFHCARLMDIDTGDGDRWRGEEAAISACTTTNTGGGLNMAAGLFSYAERTDVLRVVILLTDGPANATFAVESDLGLFSDTLLVTAGLPLLPLEFVPHLPLGFCPEGTWGGRGTGHPNRVFCQDGLVDTHHSLASEPDQYDADDFARDMGRVVACSGNEPSVSCNGISGQGATMYVIGLNDNILILDDNLDVNQRKPYGASLLRFLAALGDDGDADTDPCAGETDFSQSCGNYYYAPESADLEGIFGSIYTSILHQLQPSPSGELDPAGDISAVVNRSFSDGS